MVILIDIKYDRHNLNSKVRIAVSAGVQSETEDSVVWVDSQRGGKTSVYRCEALTPYGSQYKKLHMV